MAAGAEIAKSRRCANHPDRDGVGVCVRCRSVICVECCTKIEGINYCTRCLQRAAQQQRRPESRPISAGGQGLIYAGAAAVVATVAVMVAICAYFLSILTPSG